MIIAQKNNNDVWRDRLYLILAGVFISSLVASNLIFQKFFVLTPFSFLDIFSNYELFKKIANYSFELSVGILPYPITFLVTDIVSEIYGRKKANQIVISGFISSLFIMLVVIIANMVPATDWSPVNNEVFSKVFGLYGPAVFASMTAYLFAQLIDIRIYHFWKRILKGRHLWIRNNLSTIFSQSLDTFLILFLLCSGNVIEWDKFSNLFIQGFLFKVMIAIIDTPIIYICVGYLRRKFKLKVGQELI